MRSDWSSRSCPWHQERQPGPARCDRQGDQSGLGKPQRVVAEFTAGETIALAQRGHAIDMRGMTQRIETPIDAELGNSALGIRFEDDRAGAADAWLDTWMNTSGGKAR